MGDNVVLMIPIVVIVGLWAFLIVGALARARVREAEIRERIALIEKGHVPPPEVDPKRFDHAMGAVKLKAQIDRNDETHYPSRGSYRHRRAGTTLIGVGLGLMVLITFAAGDPQRGVGIGGFIVILGVAFVVNSLFGPRPISDRPSEPQGSVPSEGPRPE
jgi:hypothetical protein